MDVKSGGAVEKIVTAQRGKIYADVPAARRGNDTVPSSVCCAGGVRSISSRVSSSLPLTGVFDDYKMSIKIKYTTLMCIVFFMEIFLYTNVFVFCLFCRDSKFVVERQ